MTIPWFIPHVHVTKKTPCHRHAMGWSQLESYVTSWRAGPTSWANGKKAHPKNWEYIWLCIYIYIYIYKFYIYIYTYVYILRVCRMYIEDVWTLSVSFFFYSVVVCSMRETSVQTPLKHLPAPTSKLSMAMGVPHKIDGLYFGKSHLLVDEKIIRASPSDHPFVDGIFHENPWNEASSLLVSLCPFSTPPQPLIIRRPSIGMMATSAGPGQRPISPQPKPKQLAPADTFLHPGYTLQWI